MPSSEYTIRVGADPSIHSGPISRRLKPFALDIRGVCSKWKSIIDSEETFSLTRYWFASLVLAVPSYYILKKTDQSEKRKYVSFAKQMLQLRSQLTSSRGCDLLISLFSSEGMEKWDDSMDLYSETGIMVRLMAYALIDLKKHSKQIVEFSVISDEPHVVLNTIALLSMIPQRESRLFKLGFDQIGGLEVPETLLKTELNAVWRRTEDPSRSSTLRDFSHLTNLDTLRARNSSWLSGSAQLPIGTSRMHMLAESRSMSWLKAFTRRQLHTFANLTYLKINEDIGPFPDRDPEVVKWLSQPGTSGQLIFPMLRTLGLFALDTNGVDFIRYSSFPKLETANIFLIAREDMTIQYNEDMTIQYNEDMTIQYNETSPILAMPFLLNLNIMLPYSWSSLTALKAFIPRSIQLGHIVIVDYYYTGQQVTSEFVDSLRYTMTMLQPLELELLLDDSSSFRFLLEILNLNLLQKLDISPSRTFVGQLDEKSPLHRHEHIDKNTVSTTIKAPNLTYLSLKHIYVEKCIRLLTNISTTNLERLKVDILVRPEDIIEFLTSGRESSHSKDDNFISPNEMPEPLSNESFELHGKEALVEFIYESLGPSSVGRVKFPKLTSSQFSLDFDGSMYAQRDTLVFGLKRCLHSVLKSRSKCGATRLMLREAIQVEVGDLDVDGDRPFKCNFRLLRREGDSKAEST